MKKIITFTLKGPDGSITGKNPEDLISICFGEPAINAFEDMKDGESFDYTLTVERKYTEDELAAMPESDGCIG